MDLKNLPTPGISPELWKAMIVLLLITALVVWAVS